MQTEIEKARTKGPRGPVRARRSGWVVILRHSPVACGGYPSPLLTVSSPRQRSRREEGLLLNPFSGVPQNKTVPPALSGATVPQDRQKLVPPIQDLSGERYRTSAWSLHLL
jgi:hypothetical protein